MRRVERTLITLAGVLAFAAVIHAQTTSTSRNSIEDVAWLQGCWELRTGDRVVVEHWSDPRGGTMLGESSTKRGGTLVEHEFVVLSERDGRLAYTAHPSGQPSATFLSRSVAPDQVVFENPAHDFPQRIGYRRKGADELFAWIEGVVDGQERRVEFPYRGGGRRVVN